MEVQVRELKELANFLGKEKYKILLRRLQPGSFLFFSVLLNFTVTGVINVTGHNHILIGNRFLIFIVEYNTLVCS